MEKATFKPVFNRKKIDGSAPVEIYCYHLGQKKYITTGIVIQPHEWDKKRRRVNEHHLNYLRVNHQITRIIADLESYEIQMIESTGSFSLDDLTKYRTTEDRNSFTEFMQAEINTDYSITPGTRMYRNRTMRYVRECLGDIAFKNLTYEAIDTFEKYMIKKGLKTSTRENHQKQLRKFVQIAVNKRKLSHNPYDTYKIKKPPKRLKNALWYDDIDRIWELQYDGKYHLAQMKFLFSCFTGLRISDSGNVVQNNVRNGKLFLTMQKTQMPVVVPLDVIDHRGKVIYERCISEDRDHIFEKIPDQIVNRMLKVISIDAKIPFPLTFHTARHTFCTLVAHKYGSVFKVMEYAGIRSVETAMGYVNMARLLD